MAANKDKAASEKISTAAPSAQNSIPTDSLIYKNIEMLKNYKNGETLSISAELKFTEPNTDSANAMKIQQELMNTGLSKDDFRFMVIETVDAYYQFHTTIRNEQIRDKVLQVFQKYADLF